MRKKEEEEEGEGGEVVVVGVGKSTEIKEKSYGAEATEDSRQIMRAQVTVTGILSSAREPYEVVKDFKQGSEMTFYKNVFLYQNMVRFIPIYI